MKKYKLYKKALFIGTFFITGFVGSYKLSESVIKDTAIITEVGDDKPILSCDINVDTLSFNNYKEVTELTLNVSDLYSYNFLKYMPNLKRLIIIDSTNCPKFKDIDLSYLKNDMEVLICSSEYGVTFTKEKYEFLNTIPHIKTLALGSEYMPLNIESDFLETIHTSELVLFIDPLFEYKYKRLPHIKKLRLIGKPYDIAIYFSARDIFDLQMQGVEVSMDEQGKFLSANEKINNIVKEIDVDANDFNKFRSILKYIVDTCEYDSNISNNYLIKPKHNFYDDGYLDGALNQKTQICGNYAALVTALCNRLNIKAFNVVSKNHMWNLVEIGDEYYFSDPTWVDNEMEYYDYDEDIISSNQWYLFDINNELHKYIYLPADYSKKEAKDSLYLVYNYMLPISLILNALGFLTFASEEEEKEENIKEKCKIINNN